jgi:hypothetical protein
MLRGDVGVMVISCLAAAQPWRWRHHNPSTRQKVGLRVTPTTSRNIPEDLNLQQHHPKNLKTLHSGVFFSTIFNIHNDSYRHNATLKLKPRQQVFTRTVSNCRTSSSPLLRNDTSHSTSTGNERQLSFNSSSIHWYVTAVNLYNLCDARFTRFFQQPVLPYEVSKYT